MTKLLREARALVHSWPQLIRGEYYIRPRDPIAHAAHAAKLRDVNARIDAQREREAQERPVDRPTLRSVAAALAMLAVALVASSCERPQQHALVPIPPAPEQSATINECEMRWTDLVAKRNPGWRVIDLDAEQSANVVANINAYPPESDFEADAVHIAEHDGLAQVLVYLVLRGCVAHVVQVEGAMLEELVTGRPMPHHGRAGGREL